MSPAAPSTSSPRSPDEFEGRPPFADDVPAVRRVGCLAAPGRALPYRERRGGRVRFHGHADGHHPGPGRLDRGDRGAVHRGGGRRPALQHRKGPRPGARMGAMLGLADSIGAIAAPFIAGQFADRHFSTERFLAVLLAVGGVIKWETASQTGFSAWLLLSILYRVGYMPTPAPSNSRAFANLGERSHDFGKVRVWGTIGWIAASWTFPMIYLQSGLQLQGMAPFLVGPELPNVTHRLADSLRFSALISWGYALFCFALPHTPPKKEGVEKLALAKAFRLVREPSFLVLVAASLPISVIHQVYFLQTPPFFSHLGLQDSQIGPAMTIGQFSEIAIMAMLGMMLVRLGFRHVIAPGALPYFVAAP